MNIYNFKGIKEKQVNFDDTFTRIEGPNGSGKSTIASGICWVFNNTDYTLRSNPNIFPVDFPEATPTVEIIFSVDGKALRVSKSQVMKVTEVGDVRKVATTNSYTVNDVPVSERDFQKRLNEYGVDLSKFEILSIPDAFLLDKKDNIRKALFEMAGDYTDLDVANRLGSEVFETLELLKDYKLEEVKAMQNATLRKITENYGKHGEIINARVEELEGQKVDIDIAEIELYKNGLNEQISDIDVKRKQNLETQKNLDILQQKSIDLQFEISGMKNSLSAVKQETLAKLSKDVAEKKADLEKAAAKFKQLKNDRELAVKRLSYAENEYRVAQKAHDTAEAMAFDVSAENCPTCGQRLPETDIAKLLENFNKDKQTRLDKAAADMKEAKTLIDDYKKSIEDMDKELETCKVEGKAVQDIYTEALEKFNAYKQIPDGEPTEDLKTKEQELVEINKKIEELKAAYIPGLDLKEVELREQLTNADRKLAQAENNIRLDERISELRDKQIGYEQKRADAEKILYQTDLIQKEKYRLLTDTINSHFSLVKWSFFKTQKNGDMVETCECFVNGKELGSSVNTALQIRAKVDICDSLQRFYNQHFPIILDGGEALDSNSQEKLITETQMVLLSVKD